jgi:hypothetical protein
MPRHPDTAALLALLFLACSPSRLSSPDAAVADTKSVATPRIEENAELAAALPGRAESADETWEYNDQGLLHCHMMMFSKMDDRELTRLVDRVKRMGTVTESSAFATRIAGDASRRRNRPGRLGAVPAR